MKIQVWLDFRCPFCYIGEKRLKDALEMAGIDAEIEMMSFELDPRVSEEIKGSVAQGLAIKYGMSISEAEANLKRTEEMAKASGLVMNYDTVKDTNTFKAHKVLQYAKEQGMGNEFTERGMAGYFNQGKHLGQDETLVEMAVSLGLDREKVREVIHSDEYGLKVRQDQQEASAIGIRGVPYFIINHQYAISGAQPISRFMQVLRQAESEG